MKTWINKKIMQGRTVRIRSALLLFWLLVLAGCGGAQPPQDAVSTQAGAKGVYSESAAGGDLAGGGQSETMADASDMSLAGENDGESDISLIFNDLSLGEGASGSGKRPDHGVYGCGAGGFDADSVRGGSHAD